jgi:hypothetical protein
MKHGKLKGYNLVSTAWSGKEVGNEGCTQENAQITA